MSIKILIELARSHAKSRLPNVPDYALPNPKYSDSTANGLTTCVIDFLNFSGQQAERISNMGRYIDQTKTVTSHIGQTKVIGSGTWIPGSGTKGTADISATINGRSVKIEIKLKDKQSEVQLKYQQSIERAGGVYIIVHSFDEFINWYNKSIL